jgi:hypothetical protein
MKISIQMISLGPHELFFLFDYQHQPVLEVKGVQYHSLEAILKKFPELQQTKHLDKLAQIANFLAKGLEFQYIEDITLFKATYYQEVELEQSSLLYEGSALKDYGIFDLSVMHPPRLKDQRLVFFVKHDYLGIPYQVSLFYPIRKEHPEMLYELLPLV